MEKIGSPIKKTEGILKKYGFKVFYKKWGLY